MGSKRLRSISKAHDLVLMPHCFVPYSKRVRGPHHCRLTPRLYRTQIEIAQQHHRSLSEHHTDLLKRFSQFVFKLNERLDKIETMSRPPHLQAEAECGRRRPLRRFLTKYPGDGASSIPTTTPFRSSGYNRCKDSTLRSEQSTVSTKIGTDTTSQVIVNLFWVAAAVSLTTVYQRPGTRRALASLAHVSREDPFLAALLGFVIAGLVRRFRQVPRQVLHLTGDCSRGASNGSNRRLEVSSGLSRLP